MKIRVRRVSSGAPLIPSYQTEGAAGFDLAANLETSRVIENAWVADDGDAIIVEPGGRALIGTGLCFEIPQGFELQIRPRSGLALKHGITVLNSPGTVDSDYRGEVGVILVNLADTPFCIRQGDRIAQGVIQRVELAEFIEADELSETERGADGFGSTGI